MIRGTQGIEWLGNFRIYSDDVCGFFHDSFYTSASLVNSWISTYISSQNISYENSKLYVTGHSRGAAVADLYVHEFLFGKNVTAYTFAAPNSTYNPAEDSNIFNIININDFVPYVPAGNYWGKYGKNIVFDDFMSPSKEVIEIVLALGDYGTWIGDRFGDYILSRFFEVKYILDYMFSSEDNSNDTKGSNLTLMEYFGNNSSLFQRFFDKHSAINYVNNEPISAYGYPSMDDVINYLNIDQNFDFLSSNILTNSSKKAFAALKAKATNIIKDTFALLSIGCPVDVDVLNSNDEIIASFRNHELVYLNSLAALGFSVDDEDFLVLPGDENFKLVINAIDDGTMDVLLLKLDNDLNLIASNFHDDYAIQQGEVYTFDYTISAVVEEIPIVHETDPDENYITYVVRFNANGGNGIMEDQVFLSNVESNLRIHTFTRVMGSGLPVGTLLQMGQEQHMRMVQLFPSQKIWNYSPNGMLNC